MSSDCGSEERVRAPSATPAGGCSLTFAIGGSLNVIPELPEKSKMPESWPHGPPSASFWPRCAGQIHARSSTRSPFQTVSRGHIVGSSRATDTAREYPCCMSVKQRALNVGLLGAGQISRAALFEACRLVEKASRKFITGLSVEKARPYP